MALNKTASILSLSYWQGNKFDGVVVNRVSVLGLFFPPKQGQVFKL